MIKLPLILLLIAFCGSMSYARNIDSLKTDAEVLSFVRNLNDYYKYLYFIPPKPVLGEKTYQYYLKKFGSNPFEKADFDNNGQTDLLFNGYLGDDVGNKTCQRISFVVLAFGKDSFQVKELTLGVFIEFLIARSILIDGKNYIKVFQIERDFDDRKQISILHNRIDTLVCKYDEFVEKSNPEEVTIEKIEFCAFGGLTFTGMNCTITDSLSVLEIASVISTPKSLMDSGGVFQTRLDSSTSSKIFGLLKCIGFQHLKRAYKVSWTDALEGLIRITYDNGKVKDINDYGIIGTYGLAALQRNLMELTTSQHWKKTGDVDSPIIFCAPFK
jgi:hypothetical protein